MAKAIRSYPKAEQAKVVARRLKEETGGLGFWAARDAVRHIKAKEVEAKAKAKAED